MGAFSARQLTKALAFLSHACNEFFLRQIAKGSERVNTPQREGFDLLCGEIEHRQWQRAKHLFLRALCNDLARYTRRKSFCSNHRCMEVLAHGDGCGEAQD